MIAEEASWVSLFNWAERTYIAVEVGRVKKIIPALNGVPVTENIFKKKNPVAGRIIIFNTHAINEIFVLC